MTRIPQIARLTRLAACLLSAPLSVSLADQQAPPSDSAIQLILAERLAARPGVGVVVGTLDRQGNRHVVAYGASGKERPFDGSTVFEIGSITKVFTTGILADMVAKGEVALDDPVAKYLPSAVRVPERNGRRITLLDLATQSSALPRLPNNLAPKDSANPYADYTVDLLYAFLSGYSLPRDPGAQYEYSNLGMGLLGHILARKAGTTYEALAAKRILDPLGMSDTRIALTPELRQRLAVGHDLEGKPVKNWDIATLEGAGALRSTVSDMLRFVAANLDSTASSVARVLATTHQERLKTPTPGLSLGLGWHILQRPGTSIVWHNGGTGGYHSFVGFDRGKGNGVVVLSSSAAEIDDIGFHVLDPTFPLAPRPKPRTEVAIDPRILDAYVGEYRITPAFSLNITKENGRLFIQATGQARLPLYPESDTEFFLRAVDAQVSFLRDSTGAVSQLILHQAGQHAPARRQ